ncbi:MAG TPA: DNA-3-methyladenine glycosylase [Planctomycetaceae bacterium]|jgi:DNA-3-methyladenine glycosylase|nr:DNA-3-methyladenine glycosylase [Planctomycetaceae bacterium]
MKSAGTRSRSRVQSLTQSFFQRPAEDVARALIGKILVRRVPGKLLRARLIETEAYLGPDDLASHASKGRTRRTEVLFGPPGRAYVYLIYGLHEMLNVVAGAPGQGQGVLIRAADPLDDWKADLSGPGRLTRALQITRLQNGLDVTGAQLHFLDNPDDRPAVQSTKRIGIDYALHWKEAPLRFVDADRRAETSSGRGRRSRVQRDVLLQFGLRNGRTP